MVVWLVVLVFFVAFMVVFNRYSPYWIERIEFRDPHLHLQEGRKLLEEGELEAAQRQFQYAIEFDDSLGWAYFYIGDIYDKLGQEERAMQFYYQAMEVDSSVSNFPYRLGNKYFYDQKYEEAIDYLEKALELEPSEHMRANALHYLGQAKIETGDYISGFYYYEKYLEEYPADYHSVLELADLYFDHGVYEKALDFYKQYLEHDPDNYDVEARAARTRERIRMQEMHDWEDENLKDEDEE